MGDAHYNLVLSRLRTYEQGIQSYHESFLATGDDEDLHQLRVHLRKSRAILKAFEKSFKSQKKLQKVTKRLSKVAKASNKTRDLDVFLDACYKSFAPFITRLPIDFYEALVKERRQERDALDAYLKSEKVEDLFYEYQQFLDKLSEKKPKEQIALVDEILEEYFNAIETRYHAYQKDRKEDHLHEVRIYFKKVRYLLEAFKGEEGASYRKMVKKSKVVQNSLGLFHDLTIQQEFVENYMREQKLKEADKVEFVAFLDAIEKRKEEVKKEIEPLLSKLLAKRAK